MISLKQSTERYNQFHNPIAQQLDPVDCGFFLVFPSDYEAFINEYGECKIEDRIHIFSHSKVYRETKKLREDEKYVDYILSFNPDIVRSDFVKKMMLVGIGIDSDLVLFYNNHYYLFFSADEEKWMKFNTLDEVLESYTRGVYWQAFELNYFTTICD